MNGSEDSVVPAQHVVQTTDIFFWYSALLVSFLISRCLEERILPGVVICRSPSPALSLLPFSIYALLTRFLVTTWVWVDGTARIFFTRWEITSLHFSFLNTWKVWLNVEKKACMHKMVRYFSNPKTYHHFVVEPQRPSHLLWYGKYIFCTNC